MSVWRPPAVYRCIDCGGEAHLISYIPEEGEIEPDTPFAYRCSDCMERFDVIWGDTGDSEPFL